MGILDRYNDFNGLKKFDLTLLTDLPHSYIVCSFFLFRRKCHINY